MLGEQIELQDKLVPPLKARADELAKAVSSGYARAAEMLFTARSIDAETAERWGLVNRVVPYDALLDEACAAAAAGAWAPGTASCATDAAGSRPSAAHSVAESSGRVGRVVMGMPTRDGIAPLLHRRRAGRQNRPVPPLPPSTSRRAASPSSSTPWSPP